MLASYLFGGNKSFEWLESMLALLHSIKYTPEKTKFTPYLSMTQNKLKLLTILTNLLVSHMSKLSMNLTRDFVYSL